ncbi:MAG: hypothetical protein ACYYKD_11940 [Rhodospirillales bacterium]
MPGETKDPEKERGLSEEASEFRRAIGEKEVLARVGPRFYSQADALEWYRTKQLPGFGGKTPKDLVNQGRGGEIFEYLEAVAAGIHA